MVHRFPDPRALEGRPAAADFETSADRRPREGHLLGEYEDFARSSLEGPLFALRSRPAPTSSEEDFPSLEEVAHRRSWRVIYSKKLEVFGGSWQAREEEKKAE